MPCDWPDPTDPRPGGLGHALVRAEACLLALLLLASAVISILAL